MNNHKLSIDLLPKGAWNNDFSRTLSKKDWDTIRNHCYKKANHRCQICGFKTDELNAHEMWDFDVANKTQTLKNIIAICTKCHGVIHFKNSDRLGHGDEAKEHFKQVNKCDEKDFANHLFNAYLEYEERNKVYRWKMIADLEKFGGKGIEVKDKYIPKIINPYDGTEIIKLHYSELKEIFTILKHSETFLGAPRILNINVDNYQGKIRIQSFDTDRIEWYLDGLKIKTKYNTDWKFDTELSVEDLTCKKIHYKLINKYGTLISQDFTLEDWN